MQQINGNDIVFSRSFIMWEGDSLFLAPPEWQGISLRFNAVKKEIDIPGSDRDLASAVKGSQITYDFAFLKNGENHALHLENFITVKGGKLTLRIARQSVGIAMLVQFDVYLEHDPVNPT